MEKYVELLYNRLDKDQQLQLYVIMQSAICEVHNSGILSTLSPELQAQVHDPDPNIRINVKTALAKAVGKQFIPLSTPVAHKDGTTSHMISVNYDGRFSNSISLCVQGGLEGLYQSGIFAGKTQDYTVMLQTNNADSSPLIKNLKLLDSMYDEFNIKIITGADGKAEKTGLLQTLFSRKNKPPKKAPTASETRTPSAPRTPPGKKAASWAQPYMSLRERLLSEKNDAGLAALDAVIAKAETEVIENQDLYKECTGGVIGAAQWEKMSPTERFESVMLLGDFGVVQSAVLCVDFSTSIPNCDALSLFMRAQSLPANKRSQLVDAGEGEDTRPLQSAINALSSCDSKWVCKLF